MHGKLEFLQTEETSLRCFNRCGKDKSFWRTSAIKLSLLH